MHYHVRLAAFTGTLLISFVLVFACQNEVGAGPAAPDFNLSDLSGAGVSLAQHSGRVVILDFWATWCPPCRMSIPELVKLQEKYRDEGLSILGISVDDPLLATNQYLKAFKEKFRINYTILRHNGKVLEDYFGHRNPAIPTMFLIDRDGIIRDKLVGFTPGAIEKALLGLLK